MDWDEWCEKIGPKKKEIGKVAPSAPFLHIQDIRRDTYSGNPQWDSWVRLTHEPTGISVECNETPSRHKNEGIAMDRLREKVHAWKN